MLELDASQDLSENGCSQAVEFAWLGKFSVLLYGADKQSATNGPIMLCWLILACFYSLGETKASSAAASGVWQDSSPEQDIRELASRAGVHANVRAMQDIAASGKITNCDIRMQLANKNLQL